MNAVELLHFSMKNSFDVLDMVVSDLTQEQADWVPPGNASSISALYWHIIAYADQIVHEKCMPPFSELPFEVWSAERLTTQGQVSGQIPIRFRNGWQKKVVLGLPPEDPEDFFWDIRVLSEGFQIDLDALHAFAHDVANAVLKWIATLAIEDLDQQVTTPIGDYPLGNFIAFFIIWNNNVHCGEISAIKGLQGLKGYPW